MLIYRSFFLYPAMFLPLSLTSNAYAICVKSQKKMDGMDKVFQISYLHFYQ